MASGCDAGSLPRAPVMMTATSTILHLPHPGGDALVLRASTIVSRTDTGLVVSDSHGVRRLDAGWSVWRHELSSDGRYVTALDAEGSRGQVWDARTGAPLLELAGGSPHRHNRGGRQMELIARAGGQPRIAPALALDPYRMTVARAERDGIVLAPVA